MSKNKIDKTGIFDYKGKYINPLNNLPYSDEYKILAKMWSNLPAYKKGHDIVKDILKYDVILVKSETGSGKSVLVPKFALHALGYTGSIVMTLPKKIITQTTAEFAASTLDVQIGEYIGYQYRGQRMISDKTILLFSTDGSIISMIKKDPLLMDIDILIIDEAHERKIQIDLLLYLVKSAVEIRKQRKFKPLKLIIMSATIDEKLFEKYFENLKFKYLFLSGETNYKIKSTFLETSIMNDKNAYIEKGVEEIHKIIKNIKNKKTEEGDILFFVTSIAECMKIAEELDNKLNDSFVMALYSSYPKEMKEYITNPVEYKHLNLNYVRRIFISTNVAESSITLDGITHVIDSGLEIDVFYEPKKQINVMKKQLITQAQMKQRKGRAGRTREGYCYHLYTKKEMEEAKAYPDPEIKKIDLKNICLSFMQNESTIKDKDATINDVKNVFKKLIEPPENNYIEDGFRFIIKHGLIKNDILTDLGKLIIDTKIDIFQSLTLLHAYQYGRHIFTKVFLIISIIDKLKNGVKDLFFEDIDPKIIKKTINKINSYDSEFVLLYELFEMISNDKENKIFDVKMFNNIKTLNRNNLYKVHSVYKRNNYKYNVRQFKNSNKSNATIDDIIDEFEKNESTSPINNNFNNEKIIECFHHGYGTNIAIKKNGKFYFNKMECTFDSYINTNKLDKIIFFSNILISGKLKISIVSK
jgi:HrpA-like RNA helicase